MKRILLMPDFALQSYPYDYVEVAKAACAKAGVEIVELGFFDNMLTLKWRSAEGDERIYHWILGLTTPGTAFLMIYEVLTDGEARPEG